MTEHTFTIDPFTISVGRIDVRIGIPLLGIGNTGGGAAPVTPATWNPSDKSTRITLSGGNNLTAGGDGVDWGAVRSTTSKTAARGFTGTLVGLTWGANGGVGFANATANVQTPGFLGASTDSFMWRATGDVYYNNASAGTLTGYAVGDTIFAYYDPATDIFEGFVNGTSAGTVSALSGLGATFFAALSTNQLTAFVDFTANFTASGPGGRAAWNT